MISKNVLGPALRFKKSAWIEPEIGGEVVEVAVWYGVEDGAGVFVGAMVGGTVADGCAVRVWARAVCISPGTIKITAKLLATKRRKYLYDVIILSLSFLSILQCSIISD